jgi:uncharacterized integral membrane protein
MSDSTGSHPSPTSSGVQLTPKTITALIIAAAALIFIFSNTDDIPLHFLWFEISAPGWVMLLALFVGGAAVGFFLGRNRYRRKD